MDLFAAIAARYSYRGPFRDQPVPRADLERIVQAGLMAPSGRNDQTTTFVGVDDPALLKQLGALPGTSVTMQQARALIACVVDRQPATPNGRPHFQVEDCAAAVENMLLAITALGYASVWIDGWLRGERADQVGQLLGVPAAKIVRIVLPLGVPAAVAPRAEKKPFGQRAWFNRYGG